MHLRCIAKKYHQVEPTASAVKSLFSTNQDCDSFILRKKKFSALYGVCVQRAQEGQKCNEMSHFNFLFAS